MTTAERAYREMDMTGRHAVVVGGSMAGLLAAHVLSGVADRVTVVDRDRFPATPAPRPGVPQGRHSHVLLEGGQRALDDLLPGFTAELHAHGAPLLDVPRDLSTWQVGRWVTGAGCDMRLFTASRPLVEWLLRRRVLASPRIEVLQATEAVGLLGDARRVRGVRVRARGDAHRDDVRPLAADLVVDASGRSTRAAQWLASLGAAVPRVEKLDTGLAYATRGYRAPRSTAHQPEPGGERRQVRALQYIADPLQLIGAVMLPLEDAAAPADAPDGAAEPAAPERAPESAADGGPDEGRYLVTVAGIRGHEPPTEEAAFADYTALLPDRALHTWLLNAVPETRVYGHRSTANLRHRYDELRGGAAGFLATGDALCAFNPVYGQGMTVAALSAVALRDALADGRRAPTARRLRRAMHATTAQAWAISAGADKNMPGATGDAAGTRPAEAPLTWYMNRLQRRVAEDPEVARAFRAAFSLTAPVSSLLAPRVARSVLFGR